MMRTIRWLVLVFACLLAPVSSHASAVPDPPAVEPARV